MGPRSSSVRHVLFLVCKVALVWRLVSSGGSRVDGVVSNRLSAIIVHRWRCPRLAPCSLCSHAEVSPIPGDGVAYWRRPRVFMRIFWLFSPARVTSNRLIVLWLITSLQSATHAFMQNFPGGLIIRPSIRTILATRWFVGFCEPTMFLFPGT